MRKNYSWVFAIVMLAVSITPPVSHARQFSTINIFSEASAGATERVYIEAHGVPEAAVIEFRRSLIERGARHVNFFAPSLIVAEVPASIAVAQLVDRPGFTYRYDRDLGPVAVAASRPEVGIVKRAYQLAARLPQFTSGAADHQFEDLVLEVPRKVREQ